MKIHFFSCFVLVIFGAKAQIYGDDPYAQIAEFVDECKLKSLKICLKERALIYVQELPDNFVIVDGVAIKENGANRAPRQYTQIRGGDHAERALDKALRQTIADYLNSHVVELKLPLRQLSSLGATLEQARGKGGIYRFGKKGKRGGWMGLMMLMYMKAITLGALALKTIGVIAFKALLIGKIALTIAVMLGMKKLADQKTHTSYEVISHPHHDDWGGYDRSHLQEMAYQAHRTH